MRSRIIHDSDLHAVCLAPLSIAVMGEHLIRSKRKPQCRGGLFDALIHGTVVGSSVELSGMHVSVPETQKQCEIRGRRVLANGYRSHSSELRAQYRRGDTVDPQ